MHNHTLTCGSTLTDQPHNLHTLRNMVIPCKKHQQVTPGCVTHVTGWHHQLAQHVARRLLDEGLGARRAIDVQRAVMHLVMWGSQQRVCVCERERERETIPLIGS